MPYLFVCALLGKQCFFIQSLYDERGTRGV